MAASRLALSQCWMRWSFDLELDSLFWIVFAVIFGENENFCSLFGQKNKMDQFGEILFLRKFNSILKILWTVF